MPTIAQRQIRTRSRAHYAADPDEWLGAVTAILTNVFEVLVEVIASLYARAIGRPWQRQRAERLIEHGKVRCVLFDADGNALPRGAVHGVAEVSERRLCIEGLDLWVRAIDGSPEEGPIDPFAKDGSFHPPKGAWSFGPGPRSTVCGCTTRPR